MSNKDRMIPEQLRAWIDDRSAPNVARINGSSTASAHSCCQRSLVSPFIKTPLINGALPLQIKLFGFGCERRFSGEIPQFGRICAMECVIKTGLCRRLSRRVNMRARKNPVRAPRNPSVTERLLKVRRPWPVRRNPVYAIVTVHKIARTFMVPHNWVEFTILSQNARLTGRSL